ncbi:alpha/beta hydrolase [Plantactinospora sp. GCM10030261]|uniref:alpha/beta hydrolase n=1 Tax=Plantactinospora sp. GCM10030261 TaxID=3273420 RepID=UPI00361737A7
MVEQRDDRVAVVLPGGMYGPYAPLLMYPADAAEARGAAISEVNWHYPPDRDRLEDDEREPFVTGQVGPVLDRLAAERPGAPPLLIGKSLGTYAARMAAERGLPAVWLTPVLTSDAVLAGLRRATAPVLLIGGTADKRWDGDVARQLTPHVLEVAGADHGMYVPGPLAGSTEVLGRVVTAVEDFLDYVVWR